MQHYGYRAEQFYMIGELGQAQIIDANHAEALMMNEAKTCLTCGGQVRIRTAYGVVMHVEHGPAQQFPNAHDVIPAPADEPVSVSPARIEVEVKLLQILYDMVVGSLDWGSGFFYGEEVDAVKHVARLLGIKDSMPPNEREPHLWHQDCALPWRCGQSAGAEIHQMEMLHA